MNSHSNLKKYINLAILSWLLSVTASLLWNISDDEREYENLAMESARAFFNQIELVRSWNAGHGGVYVPVTETTQPNPFLDNHLRDITSTEGLALTKINPAFMTRQISEIASKKNGVQFHITSLKPIRPANKPADWEAQWLRSFNKGVNEQSAFIQQGEQTLFRYMAPLTVQQGCLKCHSRQGYKLGDIRGGISVILPFAVHKVSSPLLLSHTAALFIGLLGIIIAGRLLNQSEKSLVESNGKLEESLHKAHKLTDELQKKHNELEKAHLKLQNTQVHLLQQEKMASVGQLAAGVAHEINNPMGFITSNLSSLGNYMSKFTGFILLQSKVMESLNAVAAEEKVGDAKEKLKIDFLIKDTDVLLQESLEGARRVTEIVQTLKSFSRVDAAVIAPTNINECLETTLKIVGHEIKDKVTVHKEFGELPLSLCNPQELNHLFMNIMINAFHAIKDKGDVTIRTWVEGNSITVTISDTGRGISEDKLKRIFEPFYTTREVGEGIGLGLSICYDIVKKHEGDLLVESEEGKGSTFTINLPIRTKDYSK